MTADHQQGGPQNDPRPTPPREPESWECCQSGCDPCVFDRYWEALERYEKALEEWTSRRAQNNGEV